MAVPLRNQKAKPIWMKQTPKDLYLFEERTTKYNISKDLKRLEFKVFLLHVT